MAWNPNYVSPDSYNQGPSSCSIESCMPYQRNVREQFGWTPLSTTTSLAAWWSKMTEHACIAKRAPSWIPPSCTWYIKSWPIALPLTSSTVANTTTLKQTSIIIRDPTDRLQYLLFDSLVTQQYHNRITRTISFASLTHSLLHTSSRQTASFLLFVRIQQSVPIPSKTYPDTTGINIDVG